MVAEDSRIYDKHAISKYFDTKPGNQVLSPYTKQLMGKTLTPLPQVKNHLEDLLNSVHDPLAITWKEKHKKKKNFDDWKKKAEQGLSLSIPQMKELMILCWDGNPELGIKKDFGVAFKMAEKLQAEGDVQGKAYFGAMLCKGTGPIQDVLRGISYLGMATAMGSDIAAFYLAECYRVPPLEDLDINLEQALIHFRLSLRLALDDSNSNRSMTDEQIALVKVQVAEMDCSISSWKSLFVQQCNYDMDTLKEGCSFTILHQTGNRVRAAQVQ